MSTSNYTSNSKPEIDLSVLKTELSESIDKHVGSVINNIMSTCNVYKETYDYICNIPIIKQIYNEQLKIKEKILVNNDYIKHIDNNSFRINELNIEIHELRETVDKLSNMTIINELHEKIKQQNIIIDKLQNDIYICNSNSVNSIQLTITEKDKNIITENKRNLDKNLYNDISETIKEKDTEEAVDDDIEDDTDLDESEEEVDDDEEESEEVDDDEEESEEEKDRFVICEKCDLQIDCNKDNIHILYKGEEYNSSTELVSCTTCIQDNEYDLKQQNYKCDEWKENEEEEE